MWGTIAVAPPSTPPTMRAASGVVPPSYHLVVNDIDQVIRSIFDTTSRNPDYFFRCPGRVTLPLAEGQGLLLSVRDSASASRFWPALASGCVGFVLRIRRWASGSASVAPLMSVRSVVQLHSGPCVFS
jgi:hypothetical protein